VRWKVNPLGKDRVEVLTPRVRYVAHADKYSFTLTAFEGRKRVERHRVKHRGHDYTLEGTNRLGASVRLTITTSRTRTLTRGAVRGRRFKVDSPPYLHIPLLAKELKRHRRVQLPRTHAFAERLHNDAEFRKQIYRAIQPRRMLEQPDWVDRACAIACTICHFLGEPVSCVICSLCTDPEPPIVVA
jgi:hypothetical protein